MLSNEEQIEYVTGKGMWHTKDLNGKKTPIHLADGPHGLRAQEEGKLFNNDSRVATCFPTASAAACSFDEKLIARMAKAIAKEAKEQGVSIVLGPGINIKRSPLCGRNFEYFSEDPLLAGSLATSYVKAIQEEGVGASLKHFAGNSQETHRMTMNAQIDERALREIYLSAFEKCVKEAKPATIMASYNRLNGEHSCQNKHLLGDILRGEWGYEGCVISDWGACVDLPACVEAGMDLEMPDSLGNHKPAMRQALEQGSLSQQALERAVAKISKLVEDYPPAVEKGRSEDHHALAKTISRESAVLLKNDGILPIENHTKLLVLGELAEHIRIQGGGSSHIQTKPYPNLLDVLKEHDIDFVYARGYDAKGTAYSRKLEREVQTFARRARDEDRIILFCGGLTDFAEGEGYDRESFSMPDNQKRLLEQLCQTNSKIIFLSFGGSPYDMSVIDCVNAVLQMYLGGEAAAEAAVELLLGMENPCGKLAETWPLCAEDTPCYENFGRRAPQIDDVEYRESIYVGYRYYDTFHVPVRFPFGYGLSYTTFTYDNLEVAAGEKNQFDISCDITNQGTRAGKEIVQLYVKNPGGNFLRAAHELRGFCKLALAPGESKRVHFHLDEQAFQVFDVETKRFQCVSGSYEICIGASLADFRLYDIVEVQGIDYKLDQREDLPDYFPKAGQSFAPSRESFVKLFGQTLSHFTTPKPGEYSMKNSIRQLQHTSWQAKGLFILAHVLLRLLTLGRSWKDPEIMMMVEGICDGNIDSVINQSGGLLSYRKVFQIVEKANRNGGKYDE